MTDRRIAFCKIAGSARANSAAIVMQWLPGGKRQGVEWTALNPRRNDHHVGSFRVNLRTGAWADFAVDERGGDLISLAAYLFNLSQVDAARRIAGMLGIDPHE
jgi:hypothetical protein